MATSGSIDFKLDRDSLIKQALLACGAISEYQPASAEQLATAATNLNLIVKEWQADGLQLWLIQSISVSLTQGKTSYTIKTGGDVNADRPTAILEAFIQDGSNDTPLTSMTRQEYWELGDKTSEGTPHSYYYEPQLTQGVLYLYTAPDANAAANKTVILKAHRQVQDLDAATDDMDFPVEWHRALKFALARDLSPNYGTPERTVRRLERWAETAHDKLLGWDRENDDTVQFTPGGNYR